FAIRFVVFVRTRTDLDGTEGTDWSDRRDIYRAACLPDPDRRARASSGARASVPLDLAARVLHVSPRRAVPHSVQHAGAVDVRHGAGTHLGHSLLPDRKSTRLNSSHVAISYAVFCLK